MTADRVTHAPKSLNDDLVPPLSGFQAMAESDRCLFCYDAPCVAACPTGIDIPGFIRRIVDDNPIGAATTIFSANIMGGTCARACPTEILCEQACVKNGPDERPIPIGRLQRLATDALLASGEQPFVRAPLTGKRIAVIGGGPAGLACAHEASLLGHDVTIFEAKPKAGGLNEYGLASYKMAGGFAQRETAFILSLGGIAIACGKALGVGLDLNDLRSRYDAVFLAVGLGKARPLGIDGDGLDGVADALSFIAGLRQGKRPTIGRRVIVIGGGNTAVDAAIQARLLGGGEVIMAYRRGFEQMGATGHEQALAKASGVDIRPWLIPSRVLGKDGKVVGVEFETARMDGDRLVGTGAKTTIAADMVLTAVGQSLSGDALAGVALADGRIVIDQDFATSLPGVFAGGDCVKRGLDLTVRAVADGKAAARAMDNFILRARKG